MNILRKSLTWLAACGAWGLISLAAGAALAESGTGDPNSTVPPYNPASAGAPDGLKSVLVRGSGDAAAATQGGASPGLVPVQSPRRIDPNVHQASATEPAGTYSVQVPAAGQAGVATTAALSDSALAAAQVAEALLSTAQTAPRENPLEGRPLSLLEALGVATGDRSRQLVIARGYWKLVAAQAEFNWSADAAARLNGLADGRLPVEAGLLATARAAAMARTQEARVEVVVAQQELADLLPAPAVPAAAGPLASDLPLVGAYRTYFEILFAQRAAPPRLRLIDRTLPLRRDVIDSRTLAVQAAISAVHQAEDARAKGTGDLQTVLLCHAELARQRHDFMTAVYGYNFDVAEYALTVADPTLPNDRLVGMLIPLKKPTPTTAADKEPTIAKPRDNDKLMQPALPAKPDAPVERPRDNRPAPAAAPTPGGSAAAPAAAPVSPYGSPAAPTGGAPAAPGNGNVPPLLTPAASGPGSGSPTGVAPKAPFGNGR